MLLLRRFRSSSSTSVCLRRIENPRPTSRKQSKLIFWRTWEFLAESWCAIDELLMPLRFRALFEQKKGCFPFFSLVTACLEPFILSATRWSILMKLQSGAFFLVLRISSFVSHEKRQRKQFLGVAENRFLSEQSSRRRFRWGLFDNGVRWSVASSGGAFRLTLQKV